MTTTLLAGAGEAAAAARAAAPRRADAVRNDFLAKDENIVFFLVAIEKIRRDPQQVARLFMDRTSTSQNLTSPQCFNLEEDVPLHVRCSRSPSPTASAAIVKNSQGDFRKKERVTIDTIEHVRRETEHGTDLNMNGYSTDDGYCKVGNE